MKSDLEPARNSIIELPTVAATIETIRKQVQARGELVVLYFNFDRFGKIEDIYGWEKLDHLLGTTSNAMKEWLATTPLRGAPLMASFESDEDFVLFDIPADGTDPVADSAIGDLTSKLQQHIAAAIENDHGENISALFELYVGRALLVINPKMRLERQIYRAIREAASASTSVEAREMTVKVTDLRETLRTRGLYIVYHPIVETTTQKVFGYEALARGVMRSMRSPEVMFDVAHQSDLIWELSRLCRSRAIEGMKEALNGGHLLFMNVDPHDFTDPSFSETELDVPDPSRVVIEITERTAIKDYPKFRKRLQAFRDRGYRFAVDDAGSGYAGLGSIANLEPDFIKLDISLITCIDSNFIKQNLVETMVRFANDQGAQVIAEGVEREEEYDMVRQLGVHLVQGFFLHKAQPGRAMIAPSLTVGEPANSDSGPHLMPKM